MEAVVLAGMARRVLDELMRNPYRTIELRSIAGKPGGLVEEISMLPEANISGNWYPVAAYRDAYGYHISMFNLSRTGERSGMVYWIGFINNVTEEFGGMVVMEPDVTAAYGFYNRYYGRPVLRASVRYGRIVLSPGEPVELSFRIYYGGINIKWLDEAGFSGLGELMMPSLYRKYRSLADNPSNATSILREYVELRKRVENLTEENSELRVRVNMDRGEIMRCRKELNDYKSLAEGLNRRVGRMEAERYAYLLVGLVIGVLLFYLALKTGALRRL